MVNWTEMNQGLMTPVFFRNQLEYPFFTEQEKQDLDDLFADLLASFHEISQQYTAQVLEMTLENMLARLANQGGTTVSTSAQTVVVSDNDDEEMDWATQYQYEQSFFWSHGEVTQQTLSLQCIYKHEVAQFICWLYA